MEMGNWKLTIFLSLKFLVKRVQSLFLKVTKTENTPEKEFFSLKQVLQVVGSWRKENESEYFVVDEDLTQQKLDKLYIEGNLKVKRNNPNIYLLVHRDENSPRGLSAQTRLETMQLRPR